MKERRKTGNVERTERAVFVLHRANEHRIGAIHRFCAMNLTSHQITRKGNLKNHRIRRLFDIKTAHQLDRRENHLSDTRDSHYASLQKPDHTFIRAHWKQQIVRVKRRSQLHSFGQIFVRQCGIGDGMQRKIGRTGQRAEVREEFDDWRSDGDRTNLHADRCSEKRFFVRREDWRKQGNATHREGNLRRFFMWF